MRSFTARALTWALLTICGCCGFTGCETEEAADTDATTPSQSAVPLTASPTRNISINGNAIVADLEYIGTQNSQPAYLLDVGMTLALGAEGDLKFSWEGSDRELLFLHVPDQPKKLVAVKVTSTYENGQPVLLNPLASLDEGQIRQLWGVEIDQWSDDIAAKVALLDFDRACLTIHDGAAGENGNAVPPLPAGLKILRIESHSSVGITNVDALKELPNLTALSVNLMADHRLDCSVLQSSKSLRYLNLTGSTLRNVSALSTLDALQILDLAYCRELADLSFAKSLQALERLDISNTEVSDLSPLSKLRSLTNVTANVTPVRRLPGSVPALQELEILSTKVRSADVNAFREAHPQCAVRFGWRDALLNALANVDRLRIRSGGTCHRDQASEQTLFETKEQAEIQQLLSGIDINEEESGFHCMCCGEPTFEFYRNDQLIATVGFHHGTGLRWVDQWPGDAALSPQSATFLVDWLAARNVRGPSDERDARSERARMAQRKFAQATVGMPPTLAEAFKSGPDTFTAVLTQEVPGKMEQVAIWLRILGTSNDSWTMADAIEQVAEAGLRDYDTDTLGSAVEAALMSDDRQLRRGAARFWKSWRSPLEDWQPANVAALHRIVLQVQLQARYYPLRMDAMQRLVAWREDLSDADVDQFLSAGLHDPAPQVRRQAMLTAGQLKHQASVALLLDVLQGKETPTAPLPEVSTWEQTDVSAGFGDVAEGCSDADVAALALATMGHEAAKPLIEQMQGSAAMKDVALALLGDGPRLKPEHFKTPDSNQELQFAAVEAVVRSKGAFGLELALQYEQATHWYEEEYVSGKLGQMLVRERAPGAEQIVGCKKLDVLRKWFEEYGEQYLARFKK